MKNSSVSQQHFSKMQTYSPPEGMLLSPFTDWTGDESTNDLPVSGKAIRELIQSRLQMPFYLHYDQTGKAYRIFRDQADYNKWLEREEHPDDESYWNLEIANFIAPSPYDIKVTAFGSQVEPFDNTGRYVRQGVNNNSTKLRFHWEIQQDGDTYPDSMLVTYVIKNASEQKVIQRYGPNQKDVVFDLFEYLSPGTNTIDINFQGEQSKATKKIGLAIDVVVLKLSSEFPYNGSFNSNTTYSFALELVSTGNATKSVWAYLDNNPVTNLLGNNRVIESTAPNPYRDTVAIRFGQLSEGKHKFQIQATATLNGETFCSNLLYYEFVVPEDVSSQVDYVVTKYSFDNVIDAGSISDYVIYADQYKPFYLDWAYTSNSLVANKETVTWSLIKKSKSDDSEQVRFSYPYSDIQKGVAQVLEIVPDIATTEDFDCILRATIGQISYDYRMIVAPSKYNVTETAGYALKLNAIGKQNGDHSWSYTDENDHTYSTAFTNFTWDSKSGWKDGALQVSEGTQAVINFAPFVETDRNSIRGFGRTVEIEFEFSSIGDSSEPLIKIGDYVNSLGIQITPNEASFVYANQPILTTNYKENERIKLAFIMQPQVATNRKDNALLWIVNNGVLERCVSNDAIVNPENNGTIQIGSTNSKSKTAIYSIRCYDNAISYDQAFNNFAFDSSDINKVLQRNDVFDDYGNLDYDLVKTKIDTILITGQLDLILNMSGGTGDTRKQVQIPVTLQRICLEDDSYNFIIKDCRIRAHGQSTLNYPIPSFKIWSDSAFNCSTGGAVPNTGVPEDEQIVIGKEYYPTMYHGTDPDTDCIDDNKIYKGRYSFKAGAIPAKKWVLQANYADSSCTHNGGIQRLIQSTWYNAKVDNEYVLRSAPQQFTTNTGAYKNNGWSSYVQNNIDFPYELRNSADSIPCVVFWKRTKESAPVFVGQFVFMDDKKSDYVYGERSIYNVPRDPFCFLEGNSDKDTDNNRIWDNTNVLRLEQTSANNEFSSFLSLTKEGAQFDGMDGDTYNWESDFELVYPEKEDITSKNSSGVKVFDRQKFINKVQPFINFYKWLVATRTQYNQATQWWEAGMYSSAQEAFEATAADHLDLYKIAAYYIFLLRFGLVDSLERNAQLKTYDGQHWHFEPWDMDIALGNNNQGQITFAPPVNRNTRWGETYAYTGKSSETSNWLYDALEAWQTTSTVVEGNVQYTPGFLGVNSIVTKTAAALYDAGLTYDTAVNMLDNNYSNKWCERIYNYSGHYKYIENGGSDYYTWLQGSRTTHRHWWLKSSFDYWDAEWGVGSFLRNAIYIAADAASGSQIKLVPSTETYFGIAFEHTSAIANKQKLQKDVIGTFSLPQVSSTKVPLYLLGASYIKELDLSGIMPSMSVLNLSGCYDQAVHSSNLKSLNIGIPVADMETGVYNSRAFTISINESVDSTSGDAAEDAGLGVISYVLKDVEEFNMQGFVGTTVQQNVTKWLGAMQNLKDFRSVGSTYTVFPGIASATTYNVLQLPSTVTAMTLKDANWQFAASTDTNPNTSTGFSIWDKNVNDQFEQVGNDYYTDTLKNLYMPGTTGHNKCSYDFVKKIIAAYKTTYPSDYRTRLNAITLEIEDINWNAQSTGGAYMTYEELLDLGSFNGGNPQASPTSFNGSNKIQGYVVMANEGASDEVLTQQFTALQNVFGQSIFDKKSNGLTIDYERNTIVLTVGTLSTYPSEKFQHVSAAQSTWKALSTDNSYSEYYLVHEGYFSNGNPYRFPLSATKFQLEETPKTAVWKLYRKSSSTTWTEIVGDWNGIELVNVANQEFVMVPELRNVMSENVTQPQDFKIEVEIESDVKSAYIRVVPKVYPTDLSITGIKNPDSDNITMTNSNGFTVVDYPAVYKFIKAIVYNTGSELATIDSISWSLEDVPQRCPLSISSQNQDYAVLQLNRSLGADEEYTPHLICEIIFKNTVVYQTSININMEKMVFVDPYAELAVKMAYAKKNNSSTLEDAVTKQQLATLNITTITADAATWATNNNQTSPCASIVHFPEARYFSTVGINDINPDVRFSNSLKSIIIRKSSDSNAIESGNYDRFLKNSCFVNAAYVDYGNCSQFYKDSHSFDNCSGIVVFWTQFYGERSGNIPGANAYILLPTRLARNLGSLEGHNNVYVFDTDLYDQKSLWQIFYDAYRVNNDLADAKAAFATLANTSGSGIYTLAAYTA